MAIGGRATVYGSVAGVAVFPEIDLFIWAEALLTAFFYCTILIPQSNNLGLHFKLLHVLPIEGGHAVGTVHTWPVFQRRRHRVEYDYADRLLDRDQPNGVSGDDGGVDWVCQ